MCETCCVGWLMDVSLGAGLHLDNDATRSLSLRESTLSFAPVHRLCVSVCVVCVLSFVFVCALAFV